MSTYTAVLWSWLSVYIGQDSVLKNLLQPHLKLTTSIFSKPERARVFNSSQPMPPAPTASTLASFTCRSHFQQRSRRGSSALRTELLSFLALERAGEVPFAAGYLSTPPGATQCWLQPRSCLAVADRRSRSLRCQRLRRSKMRGNLQIVVCTGFSARFPVVRKVTQSWPRK